MKRVGAITQPCFTPVGVVKGFVSIPLMRNVAVILSWRNLRIVIKLVGQPNLNRTFQRASRLESKVLNQVNDSHVKILVLFTGFLLNLPGHKDHVCGSSRCPKATLTFRYYVF